MGDKHRFRLKPASSLEALATMYGYSDWNTLHAMAAREAEQPAATPSQSQLSAHNAFPLTWTRHGTVDLSVSSNDWFRHTLALGGSKHDRRYWLQQQLMAQLDRDSAGVFVNAFGQEMPAEMRDVFVTEGMLVDLRDAGKSDSQGLDVNLLADMTPESIASLLVMALMRSSNPGEDYYMQQANHLLTVVADAMQEARMPVSLNSLRALFPNGRPDGLYELVQALAHGSLARKNLEGILAYCGFDGEAVSQRDWATNYLVLMRALQSLASSAWAQTLFSDKPSAQGLFTLMTQGKCLVIEGPDESDGKAEKAVLYALRSALARRYVLPREEKEKGWVFGLAELDGYIAPALAVMAEQSRSSRTALLMTTRDIGAFKASNTGGRLLANIWNQLYVNGCSRERLLELLELMANRPVLQQPERITASVGY
ncbi:hypothetical protein WL29_21535 [Burkholderia ubonensis]|uniref:Glyoxalase-related protein domain-containing protein n=2 Tax=Burkholderia ubonensis TaxID=101571 RepID=A0A125DMC5_9BURK|nr:hypothetical protein WL29_21535 [Burkholderia ubonensis]